MALFEGEFCDAVLTGKDDRIAVVTMRRPEVMNAYHPPMMRELEQAFGQVRRRDDIWVAVLTGAGDRAFSSGHDIKWMSDVDPFLEAMRPGSYGMDEGRYLHGHGFHGLEVDKPIIAAIKGVAVGGGLSMALACDLRIAGQNARFGFPQPRRGVISPMGITYLPRLVGTTVAAEMLLSGDIFDADYALRVGLVNRVVPVDRVFDEAIATAERLCKAAPLAMRVTKRLIAQAAQAPTETSLELGHRAFAFLRDTADAQEATAAFLQKREPAWQGR